MVRGACAGESVMVMRPSDSASGKMSLPPRFRAATQITAAPRWPPAISRCTVRPRRAVPENVSFSLPRAWRGCGRTRPPRGISACNRAARKSPPACRRETPNLPPRTVQAGRLPCLQTTPRMQCPSRRRAACRARHQPSTVLRGELAPHPPSRINSLVAQN